jgi:hypothetical protein
MEVLKHYTNDGTICLVKERERERKEEKNRSMA